MRWARFELEFWTATISASDRGSPRRQRSDGIRHGGGGQSGLWIEQPPRHGADLIERLERLLGLAVIDDPSPGKKPQVAVDFLCRCVSDPPKGHSVSSRPAVALREVGRDGTRRANYLIGNRLEWSRHPQDKRDGVTHHQERPGGDHATVAAPENRPRPLRLPRPMRLPLETVAVAGHCGCPGHCPLLPVSVAESGR